MKLNILNYNFCKWHPQTHRPAEELDSDQPFRGHLWVLSHPKLNWSKHSVVLSVAFIISLLFFFVLSHIHRSLSNDYLVFFFLIYKNILHRLLQTLSLLGILFLRCIRAVLGGCGLFILTAL